MMQVLNFWVDIENSSGTRFGAGPLRALNFRRHKPLSASGTYSFEVSAVDPNISTLIEKRVAICRYISSTGAIAVFGGGVIDKINRSINETGEMIYSVEGNDLTRELTYRSVGALQLRSGSAGVTNGPNQIMALAPSGWTITGGTTITPVYAGFDGDPVLNALVRTGEHIGEHWRLGSGRQVAWLGPASGFAVSGVRAVQHVNDPVAAESLGNLAIITSLEEITDSADLITRVIPRGSGNGNAVVTLAAATDAAPSGYTLSTSGNYLRRDASETAYGQIERVIDFKDLGPLSNTTLDVQNAANMLLQAAWQYLERYGVPGKFYTVGLAVVNQILEPGTTVHVVYRSLIDGAVIYDLDDVFNILSVDLELDNTGVYTTAIEISTIDRHPVTDASFLAGQAQTSRILAAHPQLGTSVDNIQWRDEMDKDHASSFRFWLGNEYTTIQRALLRFRIQPLRSTIKSVGTSSSTTSSGGSATPTSSSGGSATPTSSAGGGQTSSSQGSHQHFTNVPNTTGNVDVEWYDSGSEIVPVTPSVSGRLLATGVSGNHAHTVNDHTHDVSIPSHTHDVSVPAHTHTVTPTINTVYGIFEETSGNTLALADLVIKLNGGADLASLVEDIGNGWYALDLTSGLVSAIFRPNQENNEVVISTATADKTARIEAQLTIRGVVQAIAYS